MDKVEIDESLRGLMQCDCEKCLCVQQVDRQKFFDDGGVCEDCLEGKHEDIC